MKYPIAFALIFGLLACSKNEKFNDVNNKGQSGSVGPFDLALSGESDEKPNTFSAKINQADGAVDFYLPNGDSTQYLVLRSFSTRVSGCDASLVKTNAVWYPSEASESADLAFEGSTLLTAPRTRSRLRMVFQNIGGCTDLEFSMIVRKLDVGALQPRIDARLQGHWLYTDNSHYVALDVATSRIDWMETKSGSYICDFSNYPMNSSSVNGGWLVYDDGGMICQYRFATNTAIDFTCYGKGNYGCSLPAQFRFNKN